MKDAPARLLAEFLGVFFLCFFGIGAISNDAGLTGVALAHGLGIFIAICAFGHISGAHFNPVVSGVAVARGEMPIGTAVTYMVAQVLGAILGSITANLMFGLAVATASTHVRDGAGLWLGEVVATAEIGRAHV